MSLLTPIDGGFVELRRWMLQDFLTACQKNTSQEQFRGRGPCLGKEKLILEDLVKLKKSLCQLQSCQGQSCRLAAGCSVLSPPLASSSQHTPLQSKASGLPGASKPFGCCSAVIRNTGVHPSLARDLTDLGLYVQQHVPALLCRRGQRHPWSKAPDAAALHEG